MHPESTSSPALPYPLPRELSLRGRYVGETVHISALPALDVFELAWAAGFFDGEGCTYLAHSGPRRFAVPAVSISQTEPTTLERFHVATARLGHMRRRPPKPYTRHVPIWDVRTSNWRDSQALLTLLWPHLSGPKRGQAAAIFAAYQEQVEANPDLGRPDHRALWTETACPLGHTGIYVRFDSQGHRFRRCRVCRKEGTQLSYYDALGRSQQAVGERNGATRLTTATVLAIRERVAAGATQKEVAEEYGLSKQTVNAIVLRHSWRHLPQETPILAPHSNNRRFTADEVCRMRRLYDGGTPIIDIARQFEAHYSSVYCIVHRYSWRHLPD